MLKIKVGAGGASEQIKVGGHMSKQALFENVSKVKKTDQLVNKKKRFTRG